MKLEEIKPVIRNVTPRSYPEQSRHTGRFGHWILIYYYEGEGSARYNGRKAVDLHEGCLVLLRAGTDYAIRTGGRPLSGVCVVFDLLPNLSDEEAAALQIEDYPMLNEPLVIENMRDVAPDFDRMQRHAMRREPMWENVVSAYCLTVLNVVVRMARSTVHHLVEKVIDLVAQRYAETLTNSSIAAALGRHPNYVNAVFVNDMGMSIHQYLMRYRVTKASQLLLTTQLPVSEIARQVGFRHFSHFSNCFHKLVGCAPGTYRLGF